MIPLFLLYIAIYTHIWSFKVATSFLLGAEGDLTQEPPDQRSTILFYLLGGGVAAFARHFGFWIPSNGIRKTLKASLQNNSYNGMLKSSITEQRQGDALRSKVSFCHCSITNGFGVLLHPFLIRVTSQTLHQKRGLFYLLIKLSPDNFPVDNPPSCLSVDKQRCFHSRWAFGKWVPFAVRGVSEQDESPAFFSLLLSFIVAVLCILF